MQPAWQKLAIVPISSKGGMWSVAQEYIPGSRLLRFSVVDKDEQRHSVPTLWSPAAGVDCDANGLVSIPTRSNLLSTAALYGALIGKVGGSCADVPDPSAPSTPYGTKRVFGVGTYCVIALSSADGGCLYLAMNDSPDGFRYHSGTLHVLIEEYPT